MLCPNDGVVMHPVRVESHYGQPVGLDQCGGCGGIWFDESELFRVKPGEAERIELLDSDALTKLSEITNRVRHCPRDSTRLFRFTDDRFPEDVVLERCASCGGIWLNRGSFAGYQKGRDKRLTPREVWIQPDGSPGTGEGQPAPPGSTGNDELLRKIGGFLSMELDPGTLRPLDPGKVSPGGERALNMTMSVLTALLRLLVFR